MMTFPHGKDENNSQSANERASNNDIQRIRALLSSINFDFLMCAIQFYLSSGGYLYLKLRFDHDDGSSLTGWVLQLGQHLLLRLALGSTILSFQSPNAFIR
ncbi:hypothetical protein VTL71DRAFT_8969 [Oculimacula yallundae]|uniref:Uncharacterized protein n=1 Tax=Oculimacula yallundae TaxID=86028 RepID=A0ABR4BU77_9HELO